MSPSVYRYIFYITPSMHTCCALARQSVFEGSLTLLANSGTLNGHAKAQPPSWWQFFAIEEVSELDRRWSVCEKGAYWRQQHSNWMDAHLAFFASRSIILNLVSLLAHCLASLGLLICPNLITPSIMWLPAKIRMYLFLVVSSETTGKANGDDAFYWRRAIGSTCTTFIYLHHLVL